MVSMVICLLSLLVSDRLAHELERKEMRQVELWSMAMNKTSDSPIRNYKGDLEELITFILDGNDDIPRIVTDENLNLLSSKYIPERAIDDEDALYKTIIKLSNLNSPLEIKLYNGMYVTTRYIFYGNSSAINMLRFFPVVSIIIVLVLFSFSYITYNSSKRDEQNKVWIGMAKETAHQLGTPTSSLLGWVEYLRSQNVDEMAVNEMSKDVERLLTVVDRFSKIGSTTVLERLNITDVAYKTAEYFKQRVPKKVKLTFTAKEEKPLIADANEVLYGWVLENLIRNSIDALAGAGEVEVIAYGDKKWVYVDVRDTGKGIADANIEKIFKPGFTTKSRGWGLGLSLSYRIISEYHKGKIFVAESGLNKGTTIRIMINRL